MRTVIVCVGALLLMAAGLYFQLSRQDSGPAEGSRIPSAAGVRSVIV